MFELRALYGRCSFRSVATGRRSLRSMPASGHFWIPSSRRPSTRRSIEHNPGYRLLAKALERHAGPDAGSMMRSPFSSLSADELRDLITGAGFREVRIFLGIGPVRYPSAEELVHQEAASSPLAESILSLEDDVRMALIRDVGEALRTYTDDDGIVFPTETYLAVARR
jgi:hypothetical protein